MQINLCGYGWLGKPLARNLTRNGHRVVATKRSAAPSAEHSNQDITILPMTLGEPLKTNELQTLFACDILIINIPPGRKSFTPDIFLKNMCQLIDQALDNGTSHILFISTTAVYGDIEGIVTELTPVKARTESAKVHVAIESYIQKTFANRATILRLAGLVGEDRHPVKYLSGKHNIANGQHRVNLVHQKDVISSVLQIIDKGLFGETLHLCCAEHPTRQEYYTWAAEQLNLPAPQFTQAGNDQGKTIIPIETLKKLELKLTYPSPYDFPLTAR